MQSELTPVADNLGYDRTMRGHAPDQSVFGRYRLRRVLGRGGMGVVWLAHDQRLEREVALKFLPEEISFDAAALDELKRETRRCLDITHPNIIRIYDLVEDSQAAAIAMEYIDGKTLAEMRVEKKERVFEVKDIEAWIGKVCAALQYAHQEVGVVHRDLKPANFMMTSRDQVKIADFGIAQTMCDSMSRMTMRRGTSGTLAYMSPQQLNGELSRPSDDIYAIGTTIYELLTSKPPFYSGDISFQVRLSVPATLKERREQLEIDGSVIPQKWEDAVACCLAKAPEERPANMLELAERLGVSTSMSTPAATVKAGVAASVRVREESKTASIRRPEMRLPDIRLPEMKWADMRNIWSNRAYRFAAVGAIGVAMLAVVGVELRSTRPTSRALPQAHAVPLVTAGAGEVRINSNPAGATVHLAGLPDRTTPATFPGLPDGHYEILLTAEGYDSAKCSTAIAGSAKIDLGTIPLQRSLGELNLQTVPGHTHYALRGLQPSENFRKEGYTPEILTGLPSGKYELTLSDPAFPSLVETVVVPANGVTNESTDLVRLSILQGASAGAARVWRGEMDAGKLDDAGKAELTGLLNRAFAAYLQRGLLAPAGDQIVRLQGLGQNVDALQGQLAQARFPMETEMASAISALLAGNKLATAKEKLAKLDGVLEKESLDRLKAKFQPPITLYQQEIDAALADNKVLPPAVAWRNLKIAAAKYPDDLQLLLAVAETQTRMAPEHDRLVAQLKAFGQFSADNKDFASEPSLLAMQTVFSDELKDLDTLDQALSSVREGQQEIARLRARKEAFENRRVGKPDVNPFADAVNFFGKAVTGHTVVKTNSYFVSAREKEAAISDVQDRINDLEDHLSKVQGSSEEARKNYNTFVAHVPWGPSDTATAQAQSPGATPVESAGAPTTPPAMPAML